MLMAVRRTVAAAVHAGGPAILLRAVDPVGETVVRGDVIELPGRLVVQLLQLVPPFTLTSAP